MYSLSADGTLGIESCEAGGSHCVLIACGYFLSSKIETIMAYEFREIDMLWRGLDLSEAPRVSPSFVYVSINRGSTRIWYLNDWVVTVGHLATFLCLRRLVRFDAHYGIFDPSGQKLHIDDEIVIGAKYSVISTQPYSAGNRIPMLRRFSGFFLITPSLNMRDSRRFLRFLLAVCLFVHAGFFAIL
jgi:hypothetical protein